MQELSDNPKLSQRAVYSDIFNFKYNLSNAEVALDPNEIANVRYRLFARAIRINGLSQADMLIPHLQAKLESVVEDKINPYTNFDGISGIVCVKDSSLIFDRLETNKYNAFDARLCYGNAGNLLLWPKVVMVHDIVTNRGHALEVLFARLCLAANTERDSWKEEEVRKKTLHFIFLEICARPDYADMLRKEISSIERFGYETITHLPILDSFIKEAVRLNPLDKLAVRRKALQPFTFSHGGPHVATGQIVCLSAGELMHNELKYPSPSEFDGLRFVENHATGSAGSPVNDVRGTPFTEASKDFPIWGLGSKAWYVVLTFKIMSSASKTDPNLIDGSGRHGNCLTSPLGFYFGGSNLAKKLRKSHA
ncbi:MAG: hypothetical protein Q9217_006253 [Psora testacea]